MSSDDFDDPAKEAAWLQSRRRQLLEYLEREGVRHGTVPHEAAWFVAPYVSVWPIMSLRAPGAVGWWGIAGDLPTDYVSSTDIEDPRAALRAFAARWRDVADYMRRGEAHPEITIGEWSEWPKLSDLLRCRADLLQEIADDEEEWDEDQSRRTR